ncbi:MAG TPA: type III pantothenate kinase [Dokdonella sp.]|uniref:type III pantothenate kinase n=1 Tax=Dokdonella sp. TaxID=2291710 RepID=UPI002B9D8C96|nr:type III pantothenate kinase [Dokdonella sp.]HUD41871.1 type III pantothenate kinase [Dokdonella sp.]
MKLLIDFGNTRLKWATATTGRLTAGQPVAADAPALSDALGTAFAALAGRIDGVLVSSVVSDARETELRALLDTTLPGVPVSFVRSPASALGVRNAYAEPQRLGVDRFLALVALHAQPRAQVLVSVGTALTLDALAADGRHLGGLIAASPTLTRGALAAATARLLPPSREVHLLADSTADAVQSGAVLAAVALTERFRSGAAGPLGAWPALVLAGGGADELAPWLPDAERIDDLVLQGLARWASG